MQISTDTWKIIAIIAAIVIPAAATLIAAVLQPYIQSRLNQPAATPQMMATKNARSGFWTALRIVVFPSLPLFILNWISIGIALYIFILEIRSDEPLSRITVFLMSFSAGAVFLGVLMHAILVILNLIFHLIEKFNNHVDLTRDIWTVVKPLVEKELEPRIDRLLSVAKWFLFGK